MRSRPIGVFDSGLGGVSVLRNMSALLPKEDFIYFGDDKNAPYGTKSEEEILRLAIDDTSFLLQKNVKAIVIACNTATSAAANHLRETLSVPVIGMEPALKPASLSRKEGVIGVMATPATLKQKKFRLLYEKYGDHAMPIPCPGLMEFAEKGILSGEEIDVFLKNLLAPYRKFPLESVVLGCTHYVFLKAAISKALPGVILYDGNEGTARQLKRVLEERNWLKETGEGSVSMYTSGDESHILPLMWSLFREKIL
ncbi:MAG: glutamate racemase [Clostridia bacterium]|nr:glutamate racemase [Clostridia bacterium]MBQ4620286.1 glutamate racemase [Clostridia bacterium]